MEDKVILNIRMKNDYVLIKDIKDETITSSGIYVPDETYNRFCRVIKTCENSSLKEGDILIKPIGRTTPIKVSVKNPDGTITQEIFECIRENFIFAKMVD